MFFVSQNVVEAFDEMDSLVRMHPFLENDRCSLCFSCLVISRVGVVICSEIMVSTIFFWYVESFKLAHQEIAMCELSFFCVRYHHHIETKMIKKGMCIFITRSVSLKAYIISSKVVTEEEL
ncbi:hypothetical protein YC2023_086983 [Brassica napus]